MLGGGHYIGAVQMWVVGGGGVASWGRGAYGCILAVHKSLMSDVSWPSWLPYSILLDMGFERGVPLFRWNGTTHAHTPELPNKPRAVRHGLVERENRLPIHEVA